MAAVAAVAIMGAIEWVRLNRMDHTLFGANWQSIYIST